MRTKIITCPRCKEQYECKYNFAPPLGWICEHCSEYLDLPTPAFSIRQIPFNDMEERRLEEDWDGDLRNITMRKISIPESRIFASYVEARKEALLPSETNDERE